LPPVPLLSRQQLAAVPVLETWLLLPVVLVQSLWQAQLAVARVPSVAPLVPSVAPLVPSVSPLVTAA
jgi:hypothetical protein